MGAKPHVVRLALVALAVILAACSAGGGQDPTPTPTATPTATPRGPGGWVAQGDTLVAFLSLNGTDEALSGTLTGAYIPYEHSVEPFSATALGTLAADGSLSLTFDPQPAFAASGGILAKLNGSTLELTYPDASSMLVTLTFVRADAATYNSALAGLRDREAAAAASEAAAIASAQAAAQAAAVLETCSRSVAGHAALIWAYQPSGDAAAACKDVKGFSLDGATWDVPVQPAPSQVSGSLVCRGRLDKTLVYVYDTLSQYYGGLICSQLAAMPYLGIVFEPASSRAGLAVTLDGVAAGSPAARAGVHDRDILWAADEQPVSSGLELDAFLAAHSPGDHVALSIDRGGQDLVLAVTLGRWPR